MTIIETNFKRLKFVFIQPLLFLIFGDYSKEVTQ